MLSKWSGAASQADPKEAARALGRLLKRVANHDEPGFDGLAAMAMYHRGNALSNGALRDEAIAAYDELSDRFYGSDDNLLQVIITLALFNKAVDLGKLGRT